MKNLLEILGVGKENAVSLSYLAISLGVDKRKIREEINRINTEGEEIICNLGNGKGYFIAKNLEEAQAYRNYNQSYWKSGIEKDRGLKRCMERKFSGQILMDMNKMS